MNCFQIIKSVLDEAYSSIPGNDENKDSLIKTAMRDLSNQYTQLINGAVIDYSDPVTRFAYIYRYVTSHASYVYSLIQETEDLTSIFDNERVKVACIGGGPGSDFLGILKYLMLNNKKPDIKFHLCDKEKTWAESWDDVDSKVNPEFRISTSYLSLDITKVEDWNPHTKYLQADLFTMIYFVSEIYAVKDQSSDYFEHLFKKSKPDSLFLFIDNNTPEFYGWFDNMTNRYDIEIVNKGQRSMKPPSSEDKEALGEYLDKFGHNPKLSSNAAYRVGRKRQQ